jgi:hypothetical protein
MVMYMFSFPYKCLGRNEGISFSATYNTLCSPHSSQKTSHFARLIVHDGCQAYRNVDSKRKGLCVRNGMLGDMPISYLCAKRLPNTRVVHSPATQRNTVTTVK